ncbi:MAG: hypothetical protein ACRD8U_07045 [Pyrinomonadaceae bacterium]
MTLTFLNNVWLAIAVWAILYLMDYIFTLKAASMYQAGASKHFSFLGGYELNPVFKKDIAGLRRFSPRFWLLLFVMGGLFLATHSLFSPEAFAFVWGMFVGIQIAIHLRHIRNLVLFHYARNSRGMDGRIEYQHWLSLRLSAIELLSFSALFLLFYIFSQSLFMLGGFAGCFLMGLRHLLDSIKGSNS